MPKSNPIRFSSKTLAFIQKAGRQKNPSWLDRNRQEYERVLQRPLGELAKTLKQALAKEATGYHFPQKGLARLKRSANRVREGRGLYKDWVSYSSARPRKSRFETNPNLFFLLQPGDPDGDDVLLAGGLYMPSSRQLRQIRLAIAGDAGPFERLFKSGVFKARFSGGFCTENTGSRPPRGFDPAHPRIEWLKLQSYFVWRSYSKREFISCDFSKQVAKDCRQILRLNRLLDQAIEGRQTVDLPREGDLPQGLRSKLEELQGPQAGDGFLAGVPLKPGRLSATGL